MVCWLKSCMHRKETAKPIEMKFYVTVGTRGPNVITHTNYDDDSTLCGNVERSVIMLIASGTKHYTTRVCVVYRQITEVICLYIIIDSTRWKVQQIH